MQISMWSFEVILTIMLASNCLGQDVIETTTTELPTTTTTNVKTTTSSEDKPVTTEPSIVQDVTVTPTPITTPPPSTKKPAPIVIPSDNSSNHEVNFPTNVTPLRSDERTIPKAPPPTPSTPIPTSGAFGIGELLKIPGVNLAHLDKANAVMEAVQKLG